MSASQPLTIAIIGGGIVGTVLTIALRRRGLKVDLYERGTSLSEISASMGVNNSAAEALKVCSPEAYEAFVEVRTTPTNPAVAQEIFDGYNVPSKGGWTLPWDGETGGVHRGQFLEALVKHLSPEDGGIHFGKYLDGIVETEGEQTKLVFRDGSTAFADAVIGADGVGSHVRRYMLGENHPSARARYAHQYCYRTVMDMADAEKHLPDLRFAHQTTGWMGKNAHIITVPIARGTMLGLTACVSDPNPWPSAHHTVLPATKSDVMATFASWPTAVRGLIDSIHEGSVDRWAFFDFAENPVPYYAKGTIAIAGDAAHATTPHMGSGAMCGIEDAAVLAEVLAEVSGESGEIDPEERVGVLRRVEAAFQAYSGVRVGRGEFITTQSRRVGDLEEYKTEVGEDLVEIQKGVMERFGESWTKPVREHARSAKEDYAERIRVK